MNYLSLFSGIGGFDLALDRAGATCVGQCEINRDALAILEKHWPGVPRYNDVTTLRNHGRVDLVCGGFPCQDLSVAGRRAGLAGGRSGLFYDIARIAGETQAEWLVLENVPGLLSSNQGRDMESVVETLVDLGYCLCWRVLDAQWCGVPQRRRRVFIVGRLRGWGGPAEVLFERDGLPWDSPPSRSKKTGVAALTANGVGTCGADDNQGQAGHLIAFQSKQSSTSMAPSFDDVSPTLDVAKAGGTAVAYQCHGSNVGPMGTLRAGNGNETGGVPFTFQTRFARNGRGGPDEIAGTLTPCEGGVHADSKPHVAVREGVRRLTPLECERLQGFPDHWTAGCSDSARYRMLGNAVAVPVVEWISRRLLCVSGRSCTATGDTSSAA